MNAMSRFGDIPPPPPGFTERLETGAYPSPPTALGADSQAAAIPPPPPGFTERLDGPPLPGGEPQRDQPPRGRRWLGQLLSGVNEGLLQTGEALTSVFAPGMGLLLKQLPRTPAQQAQHLGLIGPAPTDTAGRMTRKVGQYVGGSLPFTLAGPLGAAAQPGRLLARDAAAAVASGLGAGIANALAPGSTAAELAGALAPTLVPQGLALGTRTLLRGGARGQQAMQQRLQDFERAGMSPTVGQATGNRLVQGVERTLSALPGGGHLGRQVDQQSAAMGARVRQLAEQLAPRRGPEVAGRAIQQGVRDFAQRFQARAGQLYAAAERQIPPQTPVPLVRTQQALAAATAPIPGAESVSRLLINPKLTALQRAWQRDAQAGALPWEAAAALRSQLGRELGRPALISELPKAELKRLYGALSDDLAQAAAQQGPQAARAFQRANRYWRAGMQRTDRFLAELPQKAHPEQVFKLATSGTEGGATRLRAVLRSLDPEQQRTVTATVIERLGRAQPHLQDASGEAFRAATFLTRWHHLSPAAKSALLPDPVLRQDLETLARTAATLQDAPRLARPGSTLDQLGNVFSWGGALGSAAWGHPHALGVLLAGMAGNAFTGRLLTSPGFVRWLAQAGGVPAERLPALGGRLLPSLAAEDPQTQAEAAAFLRRLPSGSH